MKETIVFHTPVHQVATIKSNPELFERSIEAFENKQYYCSLSYLLNSIHSGTSPMQLYTPNYEFQVIHGPLVLQISIKAEELKIIVPFITLPDKEMIPLLRQVLCINFNELDLAQLIRQQNGLYFIFQCPLRYCHPQKIKKVLEEICRIGEKYDYDFLNQFPVKRIVQPHFTPYLLEEKAYIYQVIQESCQTCLKAIQYFESLRQYQDMWLIIRITLLKLLYVAQPQGKLFHILSKAIHDLENERSLNELVYQGKKNIEELLKMDRNEINEGLYCTKILIPMKKHATLQTLRENYLPCYKEVEMAMEQGNYRKVCLLIIHKIYESYYLYTINHDLQILFNRILCETSAQSWAVAAPVLYHFFENIMQNKIKRDSSAFAA